MALLDLVVMMTDVLHAHTPTKIDTPGPAVDALMHAHFSY